MESVEGNTAVLIDDAAANLGEEDPDVGTACYLCYGACVNKGVEGSKGRGCAKGFSDLVSRRRALRKAR